MDFISLIQTLLRRWLVVVPVLVLTMVVAGLLATRVEPTYEAVASALLISQGTTADGAEADTLMPAMASALVQTLRGADVRTKVEESAGDATYELILSEDGSTLRVEATSNDADVAVAASSTVIEEAQAQLIAVQEALNIAAARRPSLSAIGEPSAVTNETGGYTATGTAVFVAPGAEPPAYPASDFTGRVLEELINSPRGRAAVRAAGATAEYEFSMIPRDVAPVIYVKASGPHPDDVMATVTGVLDVLDDELVKLQDDAGAPESSWTYLNRLSVPETVVLATSNLLRPLVMVLALGGLAAVGLALLVDGIMTRRKGRAAVIDQTRPPLDDWNADIEAGAFSDLVDLAEDRPEAATAEWEQGTRTG